MSKEEQFEVFGYESDEQCVVCESIDTRSEPRFGYTVCIKHFEIPPVKLQKLEKQGMILNWKKH